MIFLLVSISIQMTTQLVTYQGVQYYETRYTDVGSFTYQAKSDIIVDYLIVGGGGGGGSRHSGGGGGGQVIIATKVTLVKGTYTVKVGDGGNGGYGENSQSGNNGQNSEFWDEIALGGGGGGSYISGKAGDGGSGGGGHHVNALGGISIKNPSKRGISYGNKGGKDHTVSGFCNSMFTGGGGGAGGPGNDGISLKAGDGGPGIKWVDNQYYGGGGGGSVYQNGIAGNGGSGGGGGGSSYAAAGHCSIGGTPGRGSDKGGNGTIQSSLVDGYGGNGGSNTGGGGGGGSQFYPGYGSGKGGKGGSGIVVILCQNSNPHTFQMRHEPKIGRFILFELLSLIS